MMRRIDNVFFRAGLLLALCMGVAAFCFLLPDAKVSNEAGVVLELPEEVPGYFSKAVEMSDKEKEWLPSSTQYMKKEYFPEGADPEKYLPISLSLIVSGGDKRSLHRPEVCLDAQGWSIPSKRVRTLEVEGKRLEIMDLSLLRVSNGKEIEAHYYFFWVGRGINTPQYRDMTLYSLWDNFTKNLNHRWAYPGLFIYVNPHEEDGHEKVWQEAQFFLRETLPVFHKEFGALEE